MKHQFLRLVLVLGLLSAIGRALQADVHHVQLSLTVFFLSFALSQVLYGPASDMFGRRAW